MKLLQKIGLYLAIFFLAIIQYSDTFDFEYAWDDAIVILENDRVQKGFDGMPEVFQNIKSDEIQHRYGYRPITLMSFAIDVGLWGMEPGPAHVMNVILYGIACVLLLLFLNRIFPQRAGWMSFLITALFVVHPVHTEVVANIKSRDEILAMIFGLISLLFFLNLIEKSRLKWLNGVLAVVSLILAFLSRENGLIFGVLMLLVAWHKSKISLKEWKIIVFPLLGIGVLFLIREYVYSNAFFENRSTDLIDQGKFLEDGFIGNPLTDASGLFEILANSFFILLKDLQLLVFPKTLVHDYAYAHSEIVGWSNPLVIISILFHGFLAYVVIKNWKKKSLLNFGIFFYIISVFLYLHVLKIGPDYIAERYLFVPSIGFLIALFGVIEWLAKTTFGNKEQPISKTSIGKAGIGIVVLALIAGFLKTKDRNKAWENNLTLFETDIELAPQNARLQHNYAVLLHQMYYQSPSQRKQNKILKHYEKTLEITPRSVRALIDLGKAYMEFGQMEKALPVFKKCTEIYPEISVAYIQIGKYYLAKKNYQLALNYFDQAKQKGIANPDVYYLRAVTLMMLEQNENAKNELIDGLQFNPSFGNYYSLLSDFYYLDKDYELSKKNLEKAMGLSPEDQSFKARYKERFEGLDKLPENN